MVKQNKNCAECEDCCEPAWKGYIRPLGFIATLTLFFILIFLDGNMGTFTVKAAYFTILETVLVTIVIAFYGSRGIEKTANTITNPKFNMSASISTETSVDTEPKPKPPEPK